MSTHQGLPTRLYNLLARLKSEIIQDVPLDIELCEYDCAKPHCSLGEWENCERRLQHVASEKERRSG